MRVLLILAVLITVATPAFAQATAFDRPVQGALRWTGHEQLADWLSTAGASAAVGLRCATAADRVACLKDEGYRLGVIVAVSETVKRLVHRTRPDGSDDKSFFSEHTALACAATVGTKYWALCPAVGLGRMAANKHWASDVGVGAFAGAAATLTW